MVPVKTEKANTSSQKDLMIPNLQSWGGDETKLFPQAYSRLFLLLLSQWFMSTMKERETRKKKKEKRLKMDYAGKAMSYL